MDMEKILDKIETKLLSYDLETMSMEELEKYINLVDKVKGLDFFMNNMENMAKMYSELPMRMNNISK